MSLCFSCCLFRIYVFLVLQYVFMYQILLQEMAWDSLAISSVHVIVSQDFIRPLCLSKRSPFQSFPTLTNLSFLKFGAIIIDVVCIKVSSVFSLFGAHRQPPCHFLVENITMEYKNNAEPGKAMIRGPFPNFWLLSFLARNVPNSKAKPRASPAFCLWKYTHTRILSRPYILEFVSNSSLYPISSKKYGCLFAFNPSFHHISSCWLTGISFVDFHHIF